MPAPRYGPWPASPRVSDETLFSEWDKQIWSSAAGVFNLLEKGASGSGSSGAAADHAAMQFTKSGGVWWETSRVTPA